ncbi:acyltransferase [Actinocatenispora thailandica]|uniref:Acyltransferase n=1 Tax=Actinocatenispora thailandica TaxID=227318 RepID=A0A7R7DRU5_9ACTN|nr:acyltransferase [Actinocatenispora thailandica]BCJ36688.1 acyltransferase [Actinocatenispora thailandica]
MTGSTADPAARVPAPRAPLGYRPALDGIRALSIIAVIVFHTPGWGSLPQLLPGGHMGVTVFFVLSGYLITTLLLGELHRTGDLDLRAFYLRRAARLLPGLLVVAVVHSLFWSSQDGVLKTVLPVVAALLYLSSVFAGFWRLMGKITWSWSLSVEEHFYFGWPPLLRWLFRTGPRPAGRSLPRRHPMFAATVAALLIVAIAVALRVTFVHSVRWHDMLYYSTFTRMDALAVGCLAALAAWRHRLPFARSAGWLGAAVLAVSCLSQQWSIGHASLNLWGLPLGTAAAAVLVVSVVQRPDALLSRLLAIRPLVHVGTISYGLYLWNLLPGRALMELRGHHPGHLATVLSWLVMLAAVELSYHLVERPVQVWARTKLSGGPRRRPVRPVGAPATECTRQVFARAASWRIPTVVR